MTGIINSCFSHAVAIAEGKFLTNLSPSIKKKNSVGVDEDVPVIPAPSDSIFSGEIDASIDDEDTEEEIEALIKDAEAACANLPADSEQVKLVSALLLKVRGFIAKVFTFKIPEGYCSSILSQWQVRRSPQAKKYFKKCCEDALNEKLELLPYCKTRWGSWNGVITRLLILKKASQTSSYDDIVAYISFFQAVKMFVNNADDSDDVPNVDKNQPKYASYRISETEWDLLTMIQKVLAVRHFSGSVWAHHQFIYLVGSSKCPRSLFCRILPNSMANSPTLRRLHSPVAGILRRYQDGSA